MKNEPNGFLQDCLIRPDTDRNTKALLALGVGTTVVGLALSLLAARKLWAKDAKT